MTGSFTIRAKKTWYLTTKAKTNGSLTIKAKKTVSLTTEAKQSKYNWLNEHQSKDDRLTTPPKQRWLAPCPSDQRQLVLWPPNQRRLDLWPPKQRKVALAKVSKCNFIGCSSIKIMKLEQFKFEILMKWQLYYWVNLTSYSQGRTCPKYTALYVLSFQCICVFREILVHRQWL